MDSVKSSGETALIATDSPQRIKGEDDESNSIIHEHINLQEGEEDEGVIRCICGYSEDDGYTIQCEDCYVWQHIICVGLSEKTVPDHYLCDKCNPRTLDVRRAHMLQREQLRLKEEARRRGLLVLHESGRSSQAEFSGSSNTSSPSHQDRKTPAAEKSGAGLDSSLTGSYRPLSPLELSRSAEHVPQHMASGRQRRQVTQLNASASQNQPGQGAPRPSMDGNALKGGKSVQDSLPALELRVYTLLDVFYQLYDRYVHSFTVVKDNLCAPHLEPKLRDLVRAFSRDLVFCKSQDFSSLPCPARLSKMQLAKSKRPVAMTVLQWMQACRTFVDPVDTQGESKMCGLFSAEKVIKGQFISGICGEVTDWESIWKEKAFEEIGSNGRLVLSEGTIYNDPNVLSKRHATELQPLLPFVFPHPATTLWEQQKLVVDARTLGKNDARFVRFSRPEDPEQGNAVLRTVILEPLSQQKSQNAACWRLQLGLFAKSTLVPGDEIILDISQLSPIRAKRDTACVLCGFPVCGEYADTKCRLQSTLTKLQGVLLESSRSIDFEVMDSIWDRTEPPASGVAQIVPFGGRYLPVEGLHWEVFPLKWCPESARRSRNPFYVVGTLTKASNSTANTLVHTRTQSNSSNTQLGASGASISTKNERRRQREHMERSGKELRRVKGQNASGTLIKTLSDGVAASESMQSSAKGKALSNSAKVTDSKKTFFEYEHADKPPKKVVRSGRSSTLTPTMSGQSPAAASPAVSPGDKDRPHAFAPVEESPSDASHLVHRLSDEMENRRKRKTSEVDQLMADDIFSGPEPRKLSREERKLMEDLARIERMEREQSTRKGKE